MNITPTNINTYSPNEILNNLQNTKQNANYN
jgi:hypothetical protein